MAPRKLSRNARCPCGSGRKYKHCCWGKKFDWQEDESGNLYKSIPMTQEMADILQEQRQKFINKYGREPGANDPVFFDMAPLEHVEHQIVEAMKKAGVDPAIIYAYEKTGRLVTEQNQPCCRTTPWTNGKRPSRSMRQDIEGESDGKRSSMA